LLSDLIREGKLLWCRDCCHERELDPATMPLPGSTPVTEVGRRHAVFGLRFPQGVDAAGAHGGRRGAVTGSKGPRLTICNVNSMTRPGVRVDYLLRYTRNFPLPL
jgi:hypothetical protein